MRKVAVASVFVVCGLVVAAACKKEDDSQPQPVGPTGAPSAAYGPQGAPPGYGPQPPPGYGQQPPPPGYAPPPGGTAAPAPTGAPGGMAVPNAVALPCSNDSQCGLAHCNTQYGKCAFPCVNAGVDCIQGAACLAGFCVPKPPGQ